MLQGGNLVCVRAEFPPSLLQSDDHRLRPRRTP